MWCNILLVSIFGNIILQTNAVNMCTNHTTAARDLTLSLIKGSGSSDCYCSIIYNDVDKLPDNVQSKLTFESVIFFGCKYKLVILYHKTNQMLSCNNNNTIYYTINKTDEIQLYLELTSSSNDDTEFDVKITSSVNTRHGPMIRLECLSPKPTDTTTIPSTKRTNTMKTSSPPPIISMENTTTTIMPSNGGSIPDLLTSISIFETTHTSTYDSTNSNEEMEAGKHDMDLGEDDNDDVVTAGIIGGVIGCVIGGVIVGLLIFTIKRIVEHRKKKSTSEMYSSPLSQRQPESHYTDLQLS